MEFGSEDWFERLNKMGTFPSDYVFYVDNERNITSVCLKSNAKNVGNLRYSTIDSWHGAIVKVVNCETPQKYYEVCKQLKEKWGNK